MNSHEPLLFRRTQTRRVRILLLLIALAACDTFNQPVKDEMAFLGAMTPVNTWNELKQAVENTDAELIALTTSFPTGSDTITVGRPVTIAAVPGTGAVITRTAAFTGNFFEVGSGGDLTLGHPAGGTLVLDGNAVPGAASLIKISAGSCTMRDGAGLRNNNNGGVYVYAYGNNAAFTMEGGTISGNTVSASGGGVYVCASNNGEAGFTMTGGTISRNKAGGNGGGVYVYAYGNNAEAGFTMTGGTIGDNTAAYNGGGVAVYASSGSAEAGFTMTGGTIRGNSKAEDGGGAAVYAISGGNAGFTMEGGTICGNSAFASSGGVYVNNATFRKKTSAVIYGFGEGENSNLVKNSSGSPLDNYGHAVYVTGSLPKKRETTVMANETLSVVYDSIAGNYTTFDGNWE
jgi:hypothetical protein